MADMCDDNRFELIEKYKLMLIEGTNIKTSEDEMKVLDNILYRLWQMGWLDKLEQPIIEERKKECVPWEFLERYAEWFCATVSFPEFIREAKAFYDDTYKAESGGNIT